jgi:hypothetical protein
LRASTRAIRGSPNSSGANRMRAPYDLASTRRTPDRRKWLRRAWPGGVFPLRKEFDIASRFPQADDRYPFVKVEGEGVHEIPVGPVHAGTIEPGHFRFSIVGEKILRLEERLAYKHKGIEKRFESMRLEEAARLAGRVSTRRSPMPGPTPWRSRRDRHRTTERSLALRGIMLELSASPTIWGLDIWATTWRCRSAFSSSGG